MSVIESNFVFHFHFNHFEIHRTIPSSHLTNSAQNENTSSLSDFAQHVLRQICSQEWVLERCLQNADELCLTGFLIDEMLTPKQAQRLLHMICYPENESNIKSEMDQKSIIVRILEVCVWNCSRIVENRSSIVSLNRISNNGRCEFHGSIFS